MAATQQRKALALARKRVTFNEAPDDKISVMLDGKEIGDISDNGKGFNIAIWGSIDGVHDDGEDRHVPVSRGMKAAKEATFVRVAAAMIAAGTA